MRRWLARWLQRPSAPRSGQAPDAAAVPAHLHALRERAVRALGDGQIQTAITLLQQSVEAETSAETHWLLAQAYERAGEVEEALDELVLAQHADPARVDLRAALLDRLLRAGRESEAQALLELPEGGVAEDAGSLVALARGFKRFGRYEDAIRCYRRAEAADPSDPNVPVAMGLAQFQAGAYEEAGACYARALAIDPHSVQGLHNLGILRREQGDAATSEVLLRRALARAPGNLETMNCLAHSLRDLGRIEEALALYERVLAAAPTHADARLNRAYALLAAERFGEGWDAYERRLENPQDDVLRAVRLPRWRDEAGRAVHVVAEQGLGDQILFASCLADLLERARKVSLACDARLAPLLARAFPALDVVAGGVTAAPPIGAECCVALGSLPQRFRRSAAAFPAQAAYLEPDPARVAHWRDRLGQLGPAAKIGISWAGGSPRTRGPLRSIPLERLAPVVVSNGAIAVSLQYGDRGAELEQARRAGFAVQHWPGVDAPEECAALIAALDGVVTIDNTVAHLAGAIGARTGIVLPAAAEWRWGRQGTRCRWYPAARLLRQSVPGDWAAPLRAAAAVVTAVVAGESELPGTL